MIKNKKLTFLTIFLLIFACICLAPKSLQNDTFYLIKIGQDILSKGLDFKDHFSYVADLSYTYPHFLFNILLALTYNYFNFTGIYLLTIFFYIFFALSLFYILRKLLSSELKTKSPKNLNPLTVSALNLLPSLLSLLSVVVLPDFITARSQVITYSLLIWEIYFILNLLKTGNRKYLALLILDSWLFALVHSTAWLVVFVFYLPFFAGIFLTNLLKNSDLYKNRVRLKSLVEKLTLLPERELKNFKPLLLAFLGSLSVGLLTPARICYTAFIKISLGNTESYISEHQPPVLLNNPNLLFFLLIFIAILIFTKVKLRLDAFFLSLGLFTLAILSSRHTALLTTIGIIPLAFLLKNLFLLANPKFFEPIQLFFPLRLVIFVILVLLSFEFVKNLNSPYLSPTWCPISATNFIKENFSDKITENNFRLFNEYNIGAYLLFEDVPIFIDSRANIYTKPFSKNLSRDLFDDYVEIVDASSAPAFPSKDSSNSPEELSYEELIEYYNLEYFLLYKTSALAKVLEKDPAYEKLYSDPELDIDNPENFVIYHKLPAST